MANILWEGVAIMKAEQTALENFLLDIECLNELEPWMDDINIFEILKMSKMEIRHSNFLAWLLNPNENHSFGDKILKDVICSIIKDNNAQMDGAFNIMDATLWDYETFNVERERYNIDILIVSNEIKVLICIENKIFSKEHTEQTRRYREKVDKAYPDYGKLFIYLTPDGDEAIDDKWVSLKYEKLVEIIKTIMDKKSHAMNEKEKIFVENYISGVKKHIMVDTKLQEVCTRIYFKHKQALDMIFENLPDSRDLIYPLLVEKLENEASSTGNIIFDKNASTKTAIRFNTSYSLEVFPKLDDTRKSHMWNTDFIFYYEIRNNTYPLGLIAIMDSCDNNLTENELNVCKRVYEVIEKKPLPESWKNRTCNLTKYNQISETDIQELSDEEFYADKENIVNAIFDNVMKAVEKFEDDLKKAGL